MIKFLFLLFFACGCFYQKNSTKKNVAADFVTTASGLKYKVLQNGSGPQAQQGQEVLIRETTSYLNGTVLYSNETSHNPIKVLIGGNQATSAVDEALRGMQEGEVKLIIAPPHLVKRTSYPSNVSPDSTLSIKIIMYKIL